MQLVSPLFTIMHIAGFILYSVVIALLCVLLRRETQQQNSVQDPKAAWAQAGSQAGQHSCGVRLRWFLVCGLIVQCVIAVAFLVDPLSAYDLYPSAVSIWLNFLIAASLYANLLLFASW